MGRLFHRRSVSRAHGRRSAEEHRARTVVGPPEHFDVITAMAFGLLTTLGLREGHRLLDIGCGSLRLGRVLIPYLAAGNYVGIEPNGAALAAGREFHTGEELLELKRSTLIVSAEPADVPTDPPFDFALAQSIFSHTGADLLAGWLRGVAGCLGDAGVLAATYVPGEDRAPPGWTGSFVTYSDGLLTELAGESGLRFHPLDWRHPGQRWCLFHKPGFDTSWFAEQPLTWNTYLDHELGPPSYLRLRDEA